MSHERMFRTTNCPACEKSFKYPYYTGQMLYKMTCPKCKKSLQVDITSYLTEKVTLLRGEPQTETVLELPEQLTGTLEQ